LAFWDSIYCRMNSNHPLRSYFTDPALLDAIQKDGIDVHKLAGSIVLEQGASVSFLPIVRHGLLKVMRMDQNGKEILLYHVKAGETCAFTSFAMQTHRKSSVLAICEDATDVILIPAHSHEAWFTKYDAWKTFIVHSLEKRFIELLNVVDSLAFHSISERLQMLIREKARLHNSRVVHCTHQDLADELSTSREVVSRLLKQMERQGEVQLQRNAIKLV
jgi:CRP/FNR family transcriptional regulator